jgi:hypothetical protein
MRAQYAARGVTVNVTQIAKVRRVVGFVKCPCVSVAARRLSIRLPFLAFRRRVFGFEHFGSRLLADNLWQDFACLPRARKGLFVQIGFSRSAFRRQMMCGFPDRGVNTKTCRRSAICSEQILISRAGIPLMRGRRTPWLLHFDRAHLTALLSALRTAQSLLQIRKSRVPPANES